MNFRIGFKLNRKKVGAYRWAVYPGLVGVVILVSLVGGVFGGMNLWGQLKDLERDIQERELRLVTYKDKVDELSRLDEAAANQELRELVTAVPIAPVVWETVNLISVTGNEVGVELGQWKGVGGELTSGDGGTSQNAQGGAVSGIYLVNEVGQLQRLLGALEKKLPLMVIKSVVFTGGQATVQMEGKWVGYGKVAAEPGTPLPVDVAKLVGSVKQELGLFQRVEYMPVLVGGVGRDNPF
jgi:hypothetical protein